MQHDVGGLDAGGICIADAPLAHWEFQTHALLVCLARKRLLTTDELRRGVEGLEPTAYATWSYYEKWSAAIAALLLERGVVTEQELYDELHGPGHEPSSSGPFSVGDYVRIKGEATPGLRWRKPHLRVPGYIHGLTGRVASVVGTFSDPSLAAFRLAGPPQTLYRVELAASDVWATAYHRQPGHDSVRTADSIVVDVYASWLESTTAVATSGPASVSAFPHLARGGDISGSAGHAHADSDGHDHEHEEREAVEAAAVALEASSAAGREEDGRPKESPGRAVGEAIVALLCVSGGWTFLVRPTRETPSRHLQRRGVLSAAELARTIEALESAGRRLAGADLVARAWVDEDFKRLLLSDASRAASSVGIDAANPNAPTVLIVVEDTDEVKNVVVCTLCSCYPSALLGISPSWYRSRNYRARTVRDPRSVLAEFDTHIPAGARICVHDSTADCRYMVLPQRPRGTDGWSEERLRALVTRDSLIGVTILPDVLPGTDELS